MKDKYSRFERFWYEKPKEPDLNKKRFAITNLIATSERYNHFANGESYYDNLDERNDPECMGTPPYRQYLSLKEINDIIRSKDLNEADVFFTASFLDDYLCLEALHIKEMSNEEKLEQYQNFCAEWEEQKKIRHEHELQKIKYEMENLQRRADVLAKKK